MTSKKNSFRHIDFDIEKKGSFTIPEEAIDFIVDCMIKKHTETRSCKGENVMIDLSLKEQFK